ncbi:MAG TPA: hypothetical protein VF950_27265 [Planctomycetota bacterium]
MTFRPRNSERWSYPLVICFLLLLMVPFLYMRAGRGLGCLGFLLCLVGLIVAASLKTWASVVRLDEHGLRWSGNGTGGFMEWNAIQSMDYDRTQRILVVGLVERATGRFHPLPFMTSDLYQALKGKIGAGPSELDGECRLL